MTLFRHLLERTGWLFALLVTAGPLTAGPRIACDLPVFDFGERPTTQDVRHVFLLRNAGDAPLTVTRIHPTCGCTTANLDPMPLPPGGTAELKATLVLRGRQGPQQKSIYVESDDPATPRLQLQLCGTAIVPIMATPETVYFGALAPSATASQRVAILCSTATPARITRVLTDSDLFTASVATVEEARRYEITVATRPTNGTGAVHATLTIFTDNPQFPTVLLPLYAFLRSDAAFSPATLLLAAESGPDSPRPTLMLFSRSRTPFAITGIDSPDPDLKVKPVQITPERYRLEITPPETADTLAGRHLVVHTDSDLMREVRIPIRILPPRNAKE